MPARRQSVLVASTVTLLIGAIVIGGAMWYVSRLADSSSPSPMDLAHRVHHAHLGCAAPHRDASESRSLGHAQSEVECGANATFIAIARFGTQGIARSSLHAYVCSGSPSTNSSYGMHDGSSYQIDDPGAHRVVVAPAATVYFGFGWADLNQVDGGSEKGCVMIARVSVTLPGGSPSLTALARLGEFYCPSYGEITAIAPRSAFTPSSP